MTVPDEAIDAGLYAWGFSAQNVDERRELLQRILEAAAPLLHKQALGSAASTLSAWFEERMNEERAQDVILSDYECGHEDGITTGIKAAALKLGSRG